MFLSFTVGISETVNLLKAHKLPDMTDDEIDAMRLLVQQDNVYFRAAYDVGASRIRAEIQSSWREGFHQTLLDMAKGKKSVLQAGRAMRKQVGEGKMWYWNRIARSESTLMINSAFDLQSRAAEVNFEEWSIAAGACEICDQFEGRVWKLGEGPQPVTHTHPHCVPSYTKVKTPDGWRQIREIAVGDLVLTHQGKYRVVTEKHVNSAYNQTLVGVAYVLEPYRADAVPRAVTVKLTPNHEALVNGQWKPAENIHIGDKVRVLATRCRKCGKLIPYSRWKGNAGTEVGFCSQACESQVTREEHAETSSVTRQRMAKSQRRRYTRAGERIKMSISLSRFHRGNPGYARSMQLHWRTAHPEAAAANRKRVSVSLRRYCRNHPGARRIRTSQAQIRVFWEVKRFWPSAVLELPIVTARTTRYADICIPDYKIIVEYDGSYWHKNRQAQDAARDAELTAEGYRVIHVSEKDWHSAPMQVAELIRNHAGAIEFMDVPVARIEREQRTAITVYNLSVDGDESYVAQGFAVHNCMCIRIPLWETDKDVRDKWDRETPYDAPYSKDDRDGGLI